MDTFESLYNLKQKLAKEADCAKQENELLEDVLKSIAAFDGSKVFQLVDKLNILNCFVVILGRPLVYLLFYDINTVAPQIRRPAYQNRTRTHQDLF